LRSAFYHSSRVSDRERFPSIPNDPHEGCEDDARRATPPTCDPTFRTDRPNSKRGDKQRRSREVRALPLPPSPLKALKARNARGEWSKTVQITDRQRSGSGRRQTGPGTPSRGNHFELCAPSIDLTCVDGISDIHNIGVETVAPRNYSAALPGDPTIGASMLSVPP
jgi:hypothetical protein